MKRDFITLGHYWELEECARNACGLEPAMDMFGDKKEGFFKLPNTDTTIDLSACKCDEKAILRTVIQQLSKQAEKIHEIKAII